MKKSIKTIVALTMMIMILILPYFVFAGTANTLSNLKTVASDNGPYQAVGWRTMSYYVGTIINIFFSLLGVIFVILMLYAGYHWMTAAGDESKVEKAQDTIKRAIIGLVITIGSYAIQALVLGRLLD